MAVWPHEYSFIRYLAAKRAVDDCALNRRVWDSLVNAVSQVSLGEPFRILEVGAGIGTMVERAWEWGLLHGEVVYTALDADSASMAEARRRLLHWAAGRGIAATGRGNGPLLFWDEARRVTVRLEAADLFDFAVRGGDRPAWDLIMAHAFLDLVHIPSTLPLLFGLLRPAGLFYFTLNFDGLTILEPALDPSLDAQIEALYHETMDKRVADGRPSGDSRSGRRLFGHLAAAGAHILDAGSSDWVVFPHAGSYTADETYFLHFIVHTIYSALAGHPALDPERFSAWVEQRHAQIERGELVYVAHQLDFAGRGPASVKPG